MSWQTTARVGSRGFASPGAKREGDGRTPSGVYGFGTGFGAANPGSGLGYWTLTPTSCWGSTVGSSLYNRRYTGTCRPGDERMYSYVTGAYKQGAVINYNMNPVVQSAGSAIFFHVGTGGPTAGCVSADYATVVRKLRAGRPGDVISMGVGTGRIRLYTPDTITHTLTAGTAYASEVRALQRRLNQYGYGLAVDGVYGSGTTRAVRAAQAYRHLPPTGIADYPIAHALELR
ncbi:peptidoglycan-binding protein [Actinomycetota bacterium]